MRRVTRVCGFGGLSLLLLLTAAAMVSWAQDPATRRYVKWDRLSKELIPQVVEKNLDMGSAVKNFRKASCTIELSITFSVSPNPVGGTFSFSWNDTNDNGILTEDEIEIDVVHLTDWNLGYFMREVRENIKKELATTTYNIFTICDTKSISKEGGYLMELRPSKQVRITKFMALEKIYIEVDPNMLARRLTTRTYDGIDIVADIKHTRLGEFTLRAGGRQRYEKPTGEAVVEDRTDEFVLVQGFPMPRLRHAGHGCQRHDHLPQRNPFCELVCDKKRKAVADTRHAGLRGDVPPQGRRRPTADRNRGRARRHGTAAARAPGAGYHDRPRRSPPGHPATRQAGWGRDLRRGPSAEGAGRRRDLRGG